MTPIRLKQPRVLALAVVIVVILIIVFGFVHMKRQQSPVSDTTVVEIANEAESPAAVPAAAESKPETAGKVAPVVNKEPTAEKKPGPPANAPAAPAASKPAAAKPAAAAAPDKAAPAAPAAA